jgi:uncharacterized protein with HEPN domain
MQPDTLKLLWDMQRSVERIIRFTVGKTVEDYLADNFLRSAVERQFEIIGEALTRIRKADPTTYSSITGHSKIVGFRNQLIHGYDVIDHETTWESCKYICLSCAKRLRHY